MNGRNAPPYMNPWFFPPWMQQPQEQQQMRIPDIIVPARVDKALEFVALLTQKTMTRAAVNDSDIREIFGQKLTDEESVAHATACNLLTRYFAGKLQPDVWEEVKVSAIKKQNDLQGRTGRVLNCIACQPGTPAKGCPLCNGTGRVLVMSIGSQEQLESANNPGSEPPPPTPGQIDIPPDSMEPPPLDE